MQPPAPAPRKGRGWKIVALLLFIALAMSLFANLGQLARKMSVPGKNVYQKRQHLDEVTIEENNSANKILIIDVDGVISSMHDDGRGQNMVEDIRSQLKNAAKDPDVQAVILKVNSPGGEVLASDEIYNAIADFQKRSGKPVVSSMQTLAASGGYYISAPCRWIVANELTITGSIGVIMHGWNYRTLMDKVGIRPETYKSGKFKDMLSGDRKETEIPEEEKKMIQSLIMEVYGKFTNVVQIGRGEAYRLNSKQKDKGRPLDEDWTNYADGRVLSGNQAYDLGFVDELGDFRIAVERARKLAGISNADLIQYHHPIDLGDLFRLFGKTEARSVKVDLGVEFPKLQAGCLYFLYRQAVP